MNKWTKICIVFALVFFLVPFSNVQAKEKTIFFDKTVEINLSDDTSTEVIEEEKTPKSNIQDTKWSILDFICLIGIGMIEVMICVRKASDHINDEEYGVLREYGKDSESNLINGIGLVVFAFASFIFFMNENLSSSCTLFDKWSLLMVSLFILNGCLLYLKTHKNIIKEL